MAINKVVYKGDILIDLTTDTVSPETLAVGATAHDKSGELIVGTFEGGTDTSDATASASDIMLNKTAYTADGKTTGTFTIDSELDTQSSLLTQIASALQNKAAGGTIEVEPKLQDKTITANGSYTADDGYDGLGTVNVNVAQSTPTITVSSTGLITASADGKSATKQLTTQAAKTVTPSTVSQTAVSDNVYTTGAITVGAIPSDYVKPTAKKGATTYTPGTSNQTIDSGTYLTGTQTIRGDANLKAENIKSGVSIFGVSGNYEGSGSGGSVETFTGIVETSSSSIKLGISTVVRYTDKNFIYNEVTIGAGSGVLSITIEVLKNSIISIVYEENISVKSGTILLSCAMGNAIIRVTENNFSISAT